jgi:hypothetical protein
MQCEYRPDGTRVAPNQQANIRLPVEKGMGIVNQVQENRVMFFDRSGQRIVELTTILWR